MSWFIMGQRVIITVLMIAIRVAAMPICWLGRWLRYAIITSLVVVVGLVVGVIAIVFINAIVDNADQVSAYLL